MFDFKLSSIFGRILDIKRILTNPAPPLDFVLPGLTAGSVGLLVGPGGMGKTMFELQVAVSLATGLGCRDSLFGHEVFEGMSRNPQKVVFVAAEEPIEVLWQRLHAIVFSLKQRDVLPAGFTWPEFMQRLDENLRLYALAGRRRVNLLTPDLEGSADAQELTALCSGARLLIVDPLRQFHFEDENQSAPMSAVMSVFKQIAQKSGAAVLVAHHSSRASGLQGYGDTADAGRGSTALKDDARWQINLTSPSRDLLKAHGIPIAHASAHVALTDAKNNYGAKRPTVLLHRTAGGVLVPVQMPTGANVSTLSPRRRISRERA
ncbi:AAA family ATPase [Hydrogenophaga atypica]|uniref:AAA family ATPase n=1 Tax=Hydrogenophaga atypica TaxID=249409 RepID=A0ABW2QJ64_9BURK